MTDTILSDEILETIEQLSDEGYLYQILNEIEAYVEEGVREGRFSSYEADEDLETALWISYVDINLNEYDRYLHSEKWLKRVEHKAAGCGMWYYRYSVTLLYLGRLEEALGYAEKGVAEDPEYPWGWLNLAGLRSHFGKKEGALKAIEKGLMLVPGDYEFLRRRQEILDGRTLAEMENHYIEEEADLALQAAGEDDEEFRGKRNSVTGILCDEENLAKIKAAIGIDHWEPGSPYCEFPILFQDRKVTGCFQMNEASVSHLDPETVHKVVHTLEALHQEASGWIGETTHPPLKGSLVLEGVTFDIGGSFSLDYREQETGREIPVYFTPELEINQEIQENYRPELYAPEEMDAVEDHISSHFGDYPNVFHELVSPDIHVDICLIEPTPERDYYTLVTCGMGAHSMGIPEDAPKEELSRAELLICLPPDWEIQNDDEKWYWPIRCLKMLARLPGRENTWLGFGHTVSYGKVLEEHTPFSGIILLDPQDAEDGAAFCQLPNGERVNFYQVIPLFSEELTYKLEHNAEALIDKMEDVDHVVDIDRTNSCEGYEPPPQKEFLLSREEIKPLLENWDGPEGCFATDRIMVDGCKIGYMYREDPDEDYPDSGWRFTAGDETDEYMDDPDHFGVYALNTVCNYDPDIIPYLDAPCGTAFYRDDDGEFHEEDFTSEEEEF